MKAGSIPAMSRQIPSTTWRIVAAKSAPPRVKLGSFHRESGKENHTGHLQSAARAVEDRAPAEIGAVRSVAIQ
jgi:hypothetical protein